MCNKLEEQHAIQLSFVITILLPLLELSVYLRMFSTRSKLKKEAQIHELRGVMSLHLHMPASQTSKTYEDWQADSTPIFLMIVVAQ